MKTINPANYKMLQQIGTGSFGAVYLAQDLTTGKYCAIKKIQCQLMNSIQYQYLVREIEIMLQANHPALLGLHGYAMPNSQTTDNSATIVMDYMSQGSLFEVLQAVRSNQRPKWWNPTAQNIILIGIASGMKFLHSKNIIHRDLKPENVLIDDIYEPHIGDFGLSKITQIGDNKANTANIGTPLYMAPEIFTNAPYDFRVDIYAFGMLAYEILTEINPFSDVSNPMALGMKICNGERPIFPANLSPTFSTLIDRCWAQYAIHRPTFDEIVDYLYNKDVLFEGADFNAVDNYRKKLLGDSSHQQHLTELELINLQLQQQNYDIHLMQKTLHDTMSQILQNNEKIKADISAIRVENQEFQKEFANSSKSFFDIVKSVNTEHQRLLAEIKSLNNHTSNHQQNNGSQNYCDDQNEFNNRFKSNRRCSEMITTEKRPPPLPIGPVVTPGIGAQHLPIDHKRKPPNQHHSHQRNLSGTLVATVGIFEKLSNEYKTNIIDCGLIKISGTSLTENDRNNLKNVINSEWNGEWHSTNSDNGYIQIEFSNMKVSLEYYLIKTYGGQQNEKHLRSWVVEGSDDGKNWTVINSANNDSRLNGPGKVAIVPCIGFQPLCKIIRIRQDGPSFAGPGAGFALTNIELYGKVK
ncbi:hypothetical protein TRFO_29423 [Tritrichomonas foetus]|uniref:Protein kinase domain-containing protein n=1 Tax=Tritrichomonas foetus TaxID=1144522 RepID=A0A1J4K0D8_9EUKA|nr:hypothetical protein TRFO_29423 [Tritrichomonas foetus]|eukprot:OHT03236.1 hypothetical protein TRFO_29423 [Tritrichomonas foetus]